MAEGLVTVGRQSNSDVSRAPVLALRGLSKSFGALIANDDVSLDLRGGEIHALIGPNGAGKSTLVKLITGEISADAGNVLFLGEDISGLPAPQRARRGLVRSFQVSALALEFSALQNVMLALIGQSGTAFSMWRRARSEAELTEPAMRHLERVGLCAAAHQTAGTLSHGQRRLLEIAIALAMAPKALLLDEPLAGLGSTGSEEMTRFLADLKLTCPILLIEHDMDAVFAMADRISVLVTGRILASGSVAEIRAHQDVQDAYLGADALPTTSTSGRVAP